MEEHEKITASAEGMDLFAAANSGKGFVSFFSEVFDRPEYRRRYILKGGPGTGKSSFLKRIAASSEARGRSVRLYRCSSDPDSLDGIVIDGSVAIIDGTAPHAVEPTLPGARDEIVNLGAFWDSEALGVYYGELEALDRKKSASYKKAYRYLSAAFLLEEINAELVRPYIREEKLRAFVSRIMRSVPKGEGFEILPGLQSAIGRTGRVRLDSYERMARHLYAIEDFFGLGAAFLSALIEEGAKKRLAMEVSYEPLNPDRPDGVFLRETGECFLCQVSEETVPYARIRMRRFLDPAFPAETKSEIRMNRRMSEALIKDAERVMAKAGDVHRQMEAVFGSCMDFEGLERFTREFSEKLS